MALLLIVVVACAGRLTDLSCDCSPGFFSRLKEKGTMVKEMYGVIGSACVLRFLHISPGLRTDVMRCV